MRTRAEIQEKFNFHVGHYHSCWENMKVVCKAQQNALLDCRDAGKGDVLVYLEAVQLGMRKHPGNVLFEAQERIYKWVLQTPRAKSTDQKSPERSESA